MIVWPADPTLAFVCPIDGGVLTASAGSDGLRCPAGHSFDRAREGHFNLLLVQHKASRDPGDDKAMVGARAQTLDAGVFVALADALFAGVRSSLAEWNVQHAQPERPMRVLDAGCGEGYYLQQLANRATACDDLGALSLIGVDISKWAVRAAARRSTQVAWAVATNRQLPVAPGSVDLLLSMFGFPLWPQFSAVQPNGGRVLLVDPGPDHLVELRAAIYPVVERKAVVGIGAAHAEGYVLESETRLRYRVVLADPLAIQVMLSMTPHVHRMPAQGRATIEKLQHLRVTVDVVLRQLQLRASEPPRRRSRRHQVLKTQAIELL